MISDRAIQELRAAAFAQPLATASNDLQPEHIRYAENGWWVGLSINA